MLFITSLPIEKQAETYDNSHQRRLNLGNTQISTKSTALI